MATTGCHCKPLPRTVVKAQSRVSVSIPSGTAVPPPATVASCQVEERPWRSDPALGGLPSARGTSRTAVSVDASMHLLTRWWSGSSRTSSSRRSSSRTTTRRSSRARCWSETDAEPERAQAGGELEGAKGRVSSTGDRREAHCGTNAKGRELRRGGSLSATASGRPRRGTRINRRAGLAAAEYRARRGRHERTFSRLAKRGRRLAAQLDSARTRTTPPARSSMSASLTQGPQANAAAGRRASARGLGEGRADEGRRRGQAMADAKVSGARQRWRS